MRHNPIIPCQLNAERQVKVRSASRGQDSVGGHAGLGIPHIISSLTDVIRCHALDARAIQVASPPVFSHAIRVTERLPTFAVVACLAPNHISPLPGADQGSKEVVPLGHAWLSDLTPDL